MGIQPGFGRRLREERLRQRLSQAELAGSGASASYVSLLESGRREPTPQVVQRLASRLQVDAEVLRRGITAQDAVRDATALAFGRLCLGQGDAAQAARVAGELVDAGAFPDDALRRFDVRLLRAEALEKLGQLDAAVQVLEQLRVEAEADPTRLPWLPLMTALSRCYREAGDLSRSVDLAEDALARCRELGLRGHAGHAQLAATLGAAYYERGDLLRAAQLLDELLTATEQGTRADRAAAHWNAAVVALERGRPAEALQLAERAAALLAEGADVRAVARLKVTRAWVLLGQDAPDAAGARTLLRSALPAIRQHDSASSLASAETELARCELLLGRPAVACRHARRALARLAEQHPLESARATAVLAEALLGERDPGGAQEALRAATGLLQRVGADRQVAAVWRRIADVHLAAGDVTAATAAYREALDAAGLRGSSTSTVEAPAPARHPVPSGR